MNRRSFFGRTFGAVVAATVAPFAKRIPRSPTLRFHEHAFALTMDPITRMDVIYGYPSLQPELAYRCVDADEGRGSFLTYLDREHAALNDH